MDRDEFNGWLQKQQKAYPALADWFATLPDHKGTLQIWFDALKLVSKEHAEEATMRMIRGVEPLVRYTNWHDTPRFVSEHAECLKRESRPRKQWDLPESREVDTFRCVDCRDTGLIDVFHGRDVVAIRRGTFNRKFVHRSARACVCGIGKSRYEGLIKKGDLAEFNAVSDVAIPRDRCACTNGTLQKDIEEVIATDQCGIKSIDEWIATQ
jgi:hypothetical protein